MEVTFYGTYDKNMFIEAMRLVEKETPLVKFLRYFALIFSIAVIGITLYTWIITGFESSYIPRMIRNLITAAIIGYYYFSGLISRRRLLANLFRTGSERPMQGNATMEGISIGPNEGKTLFKWDTFTSKGEKGKLLALMTTNGSVAVFHRDFFATESDWQRFRQLVNQRVIEPK